jgi:acyl carrier protein phosphodiesterase
LNYLVHLFLSDPSPGSLLGNLMGDFVKGRLDDRFSPPIRRGLEQHRRIDAFAQTNVHFRRSRNRIDPSFGHYRGILVDIFYDHFLAKNWTQHHPRPLEDFAQESYRLLEDHFALLPEGLQRIVPQMIARNWLVSYGQVETIDRVLRQISGRLKHPNPLAAGGSELRAHYAPLETDCHRFLDEAQSFMAESLQTK